MSQYDALDSMILNKIGGHPVELMFINVRDVRDECERIAKATGREAFRILDGRLQALRKAGKIRYAGKGWVRQEAKP